jgi:hypothetical protein
MLWERAFFRNTWRVQNICRNKLGVQRSGQTGTVKLMILIRRSVGNQEKHGRGGPAKLPVIGSKHFAAAEAVTGTSWLKRRLG